MKLIRETSPYIRKKSSVARMMIDVLIALIPVVVFAIVINGFKAVSVILLSLATMLISEMVFVFLNNQEPYNGVKVSFKDKVKTAYHKATINNITAPAISAIIYAMLLPAGTHWYIVIIGALIGIVIGKLLFGGLGSNIFNPAAVGRVAVMICFGSKLTYSGGAVDVLAGGTPLAVIQENLSNIDVYSLKDLFLGMIPGSMGEVSTLMILIGGIYLVIRRSCDFRSIIAMIVTFMILMLVAGLRVDGVNPVNFMLYQTLAGGMMFGAIYMITDPVTSPTTAPGRILYGIIVAVVSVLIRLLGAYPEGVAFSILIGNMLVPVIDYYKWQSSKINYKHIILWVAIIAVTGLIVCFAI